MTLLLMTCTYTIILALASERNTDELSLCPRVSQHDLSPRPHLSKTQGVTKHRPSFILFGIAF